MQARNVTQSLLTQNHSNNFLGRNVRANFFLFRDDLVGMYFFFFEKPTDADDDVGDDDDGDDDDDDDVALRSRFRRTHQSR